MNNYQAQQFWNDINGVIGFVTSIMVIGFMVGMVKPMGKFFEPPRRPIKHLPKPVVKEVTVPGGSYWECVSCGKGLPSGTKVFKAGKEVYCSISCIKLPEHHSNPRRSKFRLIGLEEWVWVEMPSPEIYRQVYTEAKEEDIMLFQRWGVEVGTIAAMPMRFAGRVAKLVGRPVKIYGKV